MGLVLVRYSVPNIRTPVLVWAKAFRTDREAAEKIVAFLFLSSLHIRHHIQFLLLCSVSSKVSSDDPES